MFKLNDKVEWKSQAGGSIRKKIGVIVEIIPAGEIFMILDKCDKHRAKSALGGGWSRDHESYLVSVPSKGKGKPTLYWPRVSALVKA